jgi:hypothetical protein
VAQLDSFPLNLPARHYAAIGQVVAQWARLEHVLRELIWRAMRLDNKQGRVLTVAMPERALFGVLRSLELRWVARHQTAVAIRELARDAQAVKPERDAIAHGVWGRPVGQRRPIRLHRMRTPGERIMPRGDPLLPADVRAIAAKIRDLNRRADALVRLVENEKQRAAEARLKRKKAHPAGAYLRGVRIAKPTYE